MEKDHLETTNNRSSNSPFPVPTNVHVVPVSINLGSLPYFDGLTDMPDLKSTKIRKVYFHRDLGVDGFPVLFCPSRMIDALEMNLFMEHRYRGKFLRPKKSRNRNLLGGVAVKTLRSISNSLRGFLAWLAETNTDWHDVYAIADGERAKAWLPPYRYMAFLISKVEKGSLSRDTANLYLNHVRQFYEWGLKMRRIDRLPFEYKRILIKKRRKDGDFDLLFSSLQDEKAMVIQTSDLTIPRKYKSKITTSDKNLAPYTSEELKCMFDTNYMRLESRRLWAQLALACGLRASEVASISESVIERPSLCSKTLFPVTIIGKFNKERKILVPRFLMEALWQHKNSPERMHRAAKWDLVNGPNIERTLFLNRSGKQINSASLTNITSVVAEELQQTGIQFKRSFHDLRATFATTLAKFMLEKHLPLGYIQYKLMALLGHTNFSSTQKYINFARSVTFEKQMQDWVNRVFSDLQPALDEEAKNMEAGACSSSA